jgi:hypothetical protein
MDSRLPAKAEDSDFFGRFREVVSDPLNLLIERVPLAGTVERGEVCLHNGHRVPVAGQGAYYGDFSRILIINRGVHEPLEEYVFQELLKVLPPAPSMLELGAYWGHYSMWLLQRRPQARVILVEPEKDNLLAGVRNFERNGYLGRAPEFLHAFVGNGQFEVDAFLESRSEDARLKPLDVLHADIQGFEMEMLAGCRECLENFRVNYLFVSTHSQELHSGVSDGLRKAGYRVEISSDWAYETTSCDGFLFASSPRVAAVFNDFEALGRDRINHGRPDDLLRALDRLRPRA